MPKESHFKTLMQTLYMGNTMTEQQNWELMGAVYKEQVEALREQLAKKEKEIQHLHELLDLYEKENTNDKQCA